MKLLTTPAIICIALISATGANAALVASADGKSVYDTDTKSTWLSNVNLANTNTFGVSGINANGSMGWYVAQNWIGAMNAVNYLGYNDWRLPTYTGNEITNLLLNTSLFSNIQSGHYWTSNWWDMGPDAWGYPQGIAISTFNFSNNVTNYDPSWYNNYSLAVRSDPVPVPIALWLFGSGLIGLAGVAGIKKKVL